MALRLESLLLSSLSLGSWKPLTYSRNRSLERICRLPTNRRFSNGDLISFPWSPLDASCGSQASVTSNLFHGMSPSDVCLLKIKEETDIPWRFEVPSADTCFHKLKKESAEGEERMSFAPGKGRVRDKPLTHPLFQISFSYLSFSPAERIQKVRKKSGNRERCRKLSLWNCF